MTCDAIWVEISTARENPFIVGSYYRPPSETLECDTISVLEDALQKIKYPLRKHVLLCEDFNMIEKTLVHQQLRAIARLVAG